MGSSLIYWLLGGIVLFFIIKKLSFKFASKGVGMKIKKGAKIIDVRTPEEFRLGHYPDAVNIPVDQIAGRISELGQDKSVPIVAYCASGGRSASALRTLVASGFTDVTNAGGLSD
ncbi:MAG: rhodanese-like domain-containing protein, partial [Spirochaetia bacterium]|nr:rhodanese-like domain-containing protein [Spirochaetia bacterium]